MGLGFPKLKLGALSGSHDGPMARTVALAPKLMLGTLWYPPSNLFPHCMLHRTSGQMLVHTLERRARVRAGAEPHTARAAPSLGLIVATHAAYTWAITVGDLMSILLHADHSNLHLRRLSVFVLLRRDARPSARRAEGRRASGGGGIGGSGGRRAIGSWRG
jgi:hypothetical protein